MTSLEGDVDFGRLSSAIYLAKELQLFDVETSLVCDIKKAARDFLLENDLGSHFYDSIDCIGGVCGKHGKVCAVDSPHLCVGGFPCAPYSQQRQTGPSRLVALPSLASRRNHRVSSNLQPPCRNMFIA